MKAQTEITALAIQALTQANGGKEAALEIFKTLLAPVWKSMKESVINKGLSTLLDEAGHSTHSINGRTN